LHINSTEGFVMRIFTKLLAATAALATAAPAAAQYYGYSQPYGYARTYGYAQPYGYAQSYAVNTNFAAQQCSAAVQNRLYNRTSIGGILGAVLGTLMTVMVSTVTKAWPAYLGLFFVLVVKFAPGGLAGLIVSGWQRSRDPSWRARWPWLLPVVAAGLLATAACIALIEMTYRRTLDAEAGAVLRLFGVSLDTSSPVQWLLLAAVAIGGGWAARAAGRRLGESQPVPPPLPRGSEA